MTRQSLHLLPLGPREERILRDQLAAGAPEAFEAVYQHFLHRVLGLTRQLLRDGAAAEDAAQETFLRFYRTYHRYRGDCSLATWIHRLATHVCWDELARRKRRAVPTPDADLETVAERRTGPGVELTLGLADVLRRLSPRKQITFYLCHVEGLTAAEIATVLEEPVTSVQKRLQRTRVELLDLWQGRSPAAGSREQEGGAP
jgi:RNA polymerase sigma-70 factor (ECF subfamily)